MAITSSDYIIFINGADAMIIKSNGLIEGKLTSTQYIDTPPPSGGPWQVQIQTLCHGAKWAVISTSYQGTFFVLNISEANQEIQRQLIEAVKDPYQRLDGTD